jgi:hypothetical protein
MLNFIKNFFNKETTTLDKLIDKRIEMYNTTKQMNTELPEIKVPGYYGNDLKVTIKYNDKLIDCDINQFGEYFQEIDNNNYIAIYS